jgi:PAS domain S-box-containing protein
MVGAMVDISEYRRITRTFEESEARYRTIFEQAPLGIAEIDIFGTIVRANAAFYRLFGTSSPAEQPWHVISLVAEEDRELVRSAAIQAQQSGMPSLRGEVRFRRLDGSTFWGNVNISVVFDENRQPLFGITLIEDISAQKEAAQRAQFMAHAEKLQALGQMASGVAHNVNQSLGLIAGHSQLALAELDRLTPNLARLRESLLLIRQAVEEGAATTKRLLAFARPGAAGAPALIDVGALLEDVARLTAPRWRDLPQQEGRPIQLTVQAEPGLIVEGWPEALHEALFNLVFNAVDALPAGGRIALTAHREDEEAIIEVADTGTGIPEELLGQIFEPFFTTKGERGTGIGLPTVFRIVERHRGTIAVRSKVGAGSTFTIRLPISAETAPPPAPPARAEHGPTQRVLVVDDDPRIADMVRQMLELDHHDVATAGSAEEALRRLEADRFDLVICDLGLGAGMNGWELAATVRHRWPGTRFILATGWGADLDPAEAHMRGVDAIIAKPFTIADLRRQLAR